MSRARRTIPSSREEGSCAYVVGKDGLARWSETHAAAWIGLREAHRRLTRELEAELESTHGLTLSGLELLGRLAAAPDRRLRLTLLASRAGLSLSRVSRLVDLFEARGLVRRQACPEDARAIHARLTDRGLRLVVEAQRTHVEGVRRRFFDRLRDGDLEALAAALAPFRGDGMTTVGPGNKRSRGG